jgi:hypothetical protein
VALGRPPIYAVYRLRRRVLQQGLLIGVFKPAPAYAGRLATLFFFNLPRRPFPELGAGASHLLNAKWFVPSGGLQVAGYWLFPSVEKTKDWIAFAIFFPGSFV